MPDVLTENRDGVLVLTLNRPDRFNAFDVPFIKQVRQTFEKLGHGQDVDAIVLTGAGKAFCAGMDLNAAKQAEKPSQLVLDLTEQLHPLIIDIRRLAKPVVAAVSGAVAGGGYGLALAADQRIAAQNAKFTPAYSRLGISPDGGVTAFLPRMVGFAMAQRIILRDETLDAQRALALGIVDEVVEGERLLERSVELARKLGSFPMESFRYTKELLNQSFLGELEIQLDRERRRIGEAAKGPWLPEGVAAFFEKRDPVFRKRDKLLKHA